MKMKEINALNKKPLIKWFLISCSLNFLYFIIYGHISSNADNSFVWKYMKFKYIHFL